MKGIRIFFTLIFLLACLDSFTPLLAYRTGNFSDSQNTSAYHNSNRSFIEIEPNNSSSQADSLNPSDKPGVLGFDYTGVIESSSDTDWYVIEKPEGLMSVLLVCSDITSSESMQLTLFDEDFQTECVTSALTPKCYCGVSVSNSSEEYDEGIYYLKVIATCNESLKYSLYPLIIPDASFYNYYEWESNDTRAIANEIDPDYDGDYDEATMTGRIEGRVCFDWYKFTTDTSGYLVVIVGCCDLGRNHYTTLELYDAEGFLVSSDSNVFNRITAPLSGGFVDRNETFYVKIGANSGDHNYNMEVCLYESG